MKRIARPEVILLKEFYGQKSFRKFKTNGICLVFPILPQGRAFRLMNPLKNGNDVCVFYLGSKIAKCARNAYPVRRDFL
ncbi:hypothetical protein EWH99_06080 [Sporolactobacillus sp. THM7-7]|nr:hypothetical protein EWH99_06080 [Sporolactobacillus sp. THM7-7]